MAIAALLAAASSVKATLYPSGGLTKMLADVGLFPPSSGGRPGLVPTEGCSSPRGSCSRPSNLVDLSAIASAGSACSLVTFLLVGGAAYKTCAETGAALVVVLAAIAVTATVLAFFAVDTLRNAPDTFIAIVGIAGLSVILDLVWKHQRGPSPPATGSLDHTP